MLKKFSLKHLVFLCIFAAISVPMVILIAAGVQYGKDVYQREVDDDMLAGLDRTVASVSRRLFIEEDLVRALSQVPAVESLLPALRALYEDGYGPEFRQASEHTIRFFEVFQGVRRSLGTIRVIDLEGDTLIKVRDGERLEPIFENFDDTPVVENGSEAPEFKAELERLRPKDVGSIVSPPGFDALDSAFNTVLPLQFQEEIVGYLSIASPLIQIDRTLDVSPRPHGGSLLVAEVNPESLDRDGLILYSDEPKTVFASNRVRDLLSDIEPSLLNEDEASYGGKHTAEDGDTWYFRQHLPYPDRLVAWLFAYRMDKSRSTSPFTFVNPLLWFVAVFTMVVGVLLAVLATRYVTNPVSTLTKRLVDYATGDREHRIVPTGASEIRVAHAAFNDMADALDRLEKENERTQRVILQHAKLTSIGQLAAGIAHEIRNPISNIFSLTKLVQRGLPDGSDEVRADLVSIRVEAERASKTIRALLDFARQGPINARDFDLSSWLADGLALVGQLAHKRRVSISASDVKQTTLHGDANMLQQALVNVLINALQATPENGEITVTVATPSGWVEIEIADQGPGVPNEFVDQVFDTFFTTKPEGEGTGLGLPIAIGIVQRHGGELTLKNSSHGGAVARIALPTTASFANNAGY